MNETVKLTNSYWEVLKSLSDEVKLRLATKLTASVLESKTKEKDITEEMISKYSGTWKDSRSTEEIISDIYNARSSAKDPLKFDSL